MQKVPTGMMDGLGDYLKTAVAFGLTATSYTASGAIAVSDVSWASLNKAEGSLAMTIAAPVPGQFLVISQADEGTSGHNVTLTAGTWDGTNTIATFDAQYKALVVFGLSATRYAILANIGSVSLS